MSPTTLMRRVERTTSLQSEFASVAESNPDLIAALPQPTEVATGDDFEFVASSDPNLRDPTFPVGCRYKLLRMLRCDKISELWLSWDLKSRRRVTVKLVRFEEMKSRTCHRFAVRERKALARLSHANVVTFHDGGNCRLHGPYTVMEYVNGETLLARFRTLQARGELMSIREVLEIALSVTEGLCHAHNRGVLHLNIKLGSVLLSSHGLPKSKLCGFAFAKRIGRGSVGSFAGPPAYASPEHLLGAPDLDERSDLYSLGVVIYALLVGRHPFADNGAMTDLTKRSVLPGALLRAVPEELSNLVESLLESDSTARPKSAAAVAVQLRQILASLPSISVGVQPSTGVTRPRRKPRVAQSLLRLVA